MKNDIVRIPILLWAEIEGERIEVLKEVSIPIGEGYCPILARQIFATPMARTLANAMIKTGWEYHNPNASSPATTPTINHENR
jgi:hypothetical protein